MFQSEWQYPSTTSTTTTSNSTSTSFTNWLLQLLGFTPSSSTNANNANNVLLGQLWNWDDNTGGLQSWQLLSETGNGGPTPVPSYNYIWLPSTTGTVQLVGLFSGESAYPVHTDHLGTPRRINSTTGSTVWQWAYDGYGETQPSGPFKQRQSSTGSAIANSYQTQPEYVLMNLRFAGQYWDERAQLAYNFMRWYSKTGGRYITPDPLGLDAGWNKMAYVGGDPVRFTDAYGLDTAITIWQPVGWGGSSFGHVSTSINSTTYSYGSGGMAVMPKSEYLAKNSFRDGWEVSLQLSNSQELALTACISKQQGQYNALTQNCGTPIQRCLKEIGVNDIYGSGSTTIGINGIYVLPVDLGIGLLSSKFFRGVARYPASRPAGGMSAPWAR